MKVFAGNSNIKLASSVASLLGTSLGKSSIGHFSDGEAAVEIQEGVRGDDVFVIQSTAPPTNDSLVELLVIIDALKWASADRITAVIPYYGYGRQDRKPRSARVPITARLVAKMIQIAGADRVITMDPHVEQIQGFFDIPMEIIYASPVLLADIYKQDITDPVVVSPDVGGVVRARAVAKRLDDADLAIIDKRRPCANESEVMHIIGDVDGRHCVIVDDLVDTAGTLCKAATALVAHGACTVRAYGTHPVLSGTALHRIHESDLTEVVVTNTIKLPSIPWPYRKIRQINIDELLAETIRRVSNGESISSMFFD